MISFLLFTSICLGSTSQDIPNDLCYKEPYAEFDGSESRTAVNSFSVYPPMQVPYHPVSTSNPEAQKAFDKGLTAMYAFNNDEAVRSFEKAASLDPYLAMAYWGIALATDQTFAPVTCERAEKTMYFLRKAEELAWNVTPLEKAYIEALSKRLDPDPLADKMALREAYKEAMRSLSAQFPDDLDAATLFAESALDLLKWEAYTFNGKEREETPEIQNTLESVLRRNPYHLGANHYYIHTVENSFTPERGLMAAVNIEKLADQWGHLLHTSSHIYMRVGDYEKTVAANLRAIAADKKYIETYGPEGRYPIHYLCHNLSFLTMAYLWQERYDEALRTALETETVLMPHIKNMPRDEGNLLAPLFVSLYFHNYNALLMIPKPDPELKTVTALWHFARALAYTELDEPEKAEVEKELFLMEKTKEPAMELAELTLAASHARKANDLDAAETYLRRAVEKQDNMFYMDWYCQMRQPLGALLLQKECFEEAQTVFRDALRRFPRNGRSLFGLFEALQGACKPIYTVKREMKEALRFSYKKLTIGDL